MKVVFYIPNLIYFLNEPIAIGICWKSKQLYLLIIKNTLNFHAFCTETITKIREFKIKV